MIEILVAASSFFLGEYLPAKALDTAGRRIRESLRKRLSRPDEILRNHDLQRLTGAAVELVILHVAERDTNHARDLKRLATAMSAEWSALHGYRGPDDARNEPPVLAALGERKLPELIRGLPEDPWSDAPRPQGPEADEWTRLLGRVDRGRAWPRLPEHVQAKVIDALVRLTPFAVRELLKNDASEEGGGLAFAGFFLIFMDEVRRDLDEIKGALVEQPAMLAELRDLWARLDQRLADETALARELGIALADLRSATGLLVGVDRKMDRVLAGMELIQQQLFADRPEQPAAPAVRAAVAEVGSTDLFDLVPVDTSDDELGLAVLRACNAEARSVYRYRMHGERPDRPLRLWDGFWRPEEFQALRHYVRIADRQGEYVDHRIRRLLGERSEVGKPCRLWLVGEAGTGKTTALQHTYFRMIGAAGASAVTDAGPPDGPVPWLLQPHLLEPRQVQRLKEATSTGAGFAALLKIWLENRLIAVPPDREARLLSSVLFHLRQGRIALLIDGFDELSRMALQNALIHGVVGIAEHFVIASRPEALGPDLPVGERIRLNPAWPFGETRNYLTGRLPAAYADAIAPLMTYLYGNETLHWLRNPRYLNIFAQILDDLSDRSDEATLGLVALLGEGEYRLLEVFQGAVTRKLHRQAANRFPEIAGDDFADEITRRLEQVADAQLRHGGLPVDAERDPFWNLLSGAGEMLLASGSRERPVLKFLNYNFIDFFLAGPIAREVASDDPLTHCHKWSDHQVRFVSERLQRGLPDSGAARKELVRSIWKRLEQFRGQAGTPAGPRALDSRFGAVNLVHLAILLEGNSAEREGKGGERAGRRRLELERDLRHLDLSEVDLGDLSFSDSDFRGADLSSTHLDRATFMHCDFRGTDLRNASAELATFDSCRFALEPGGDAVGDSSSSEPATRVEGMLIRQAKVTFCDGATLDALERAGADRKGSRYIGLFGEIFRANQRALLGKGVDIGERRYYVPRIEQALERASRDGPVFMIDLMAGGSNDRLLRLMGEQRFSDVHVLALDRDTRNLGPMKDRLGSRFASVPHIIRGRAGLSGYLQESFADGPMHADVIVGKKALHELPRAAQIELLAECHEVLRPGGTLVLFADSPVALSEAGYERLQNCLACLRTDAPTGIVRRRLVDELPLDGDADDCALFANLWVAMKDWANANVDELTDRYFSSFEEIMSWGEAAGFEVLRVAGPEQDVYYELQARIFNELGINEVGRYLESTGGVIHGKDHGLIAQHFAGNDRYRAFVHFADTHLWNFERDGPTEGLGVALGASRSPVRYNRIHPDLSLIQRLPEKGVAFRFPVHIIEMRKPADG